MFSTAMVPGMRQARAPNGASNVPCPVHYTGHLA